MAQVKLTLSVDDELVRKAKRVAHERKTSISSLISRYIALLDDDSKTEDFESQLPPRTRRALGTIKLPSGRDDRDLLTEALAEREKA
jgi:hypothetical protein